MSISSNLLQRRINESHTAVANLPRTLYECYKRDIFQFFTVDVDIRFSQE